MTTTKNTILIAEDDDSISEVMQIILREEGYKVFRAKDEEGFFAALHDELPALIFLDIRLGGDSGEDIANRLKKTAATRSIPLILVSADSETETIAKSVGANGYLSKPFEIDTLLETVKKNLS
jgi:DNA-binding response OmpR family regulator